VFSGRGRAIQRIPFWVDPCELWSQSLSPSLFFFFKSRVVALPFGREPIAGPLRFHLPPLVFRRGSAAALGRSVGRAPSRAFELGFLSPCDEGLATGLRNRRFNPTVRSRFSLKSSSAMNSALNSLYYRKLVIPALFPLPKKARPYHFGIARRWLFVFLPSLTKPP